MGELPRTSSHRCDTGQEVQELFAGELCTIVGDDDVGYLKLVDYVGEEEDSLLGANVCDGSSLDPLGELVDGHQQMGVPSCCLLESAHEVEAPHRKWPSDGDHLQCVSGEVGLLGVELTPVVWTNKLDGNSYGHWPVEALSEGVWHFQRHYQK